MQIIEFYAHKGGQGTTTVAAMFGIGESRHRAVHLVASDKTDCAFADVCGAPSFETAEGWASVATNLTWGLDAPPEAELLVSDARLEAFANEPGVVRVLVIRNDYLALRNFMRSEQRPDRVVLVVEPGRSLSKRDVEDVIGHIVDVEIPIDPAIARAVDAGLLVARRPRSGAREIDRLALSLNLTPEVTP